MQKIKNDNGVRLILTRKVIVDIDLNYQVTMDNLPLIDPLAPEEDQALCHMSNNLVSMIDATHTVKRIIEGTKDDGAKEELEKIYLFLSNLCSSNAYYIGKSVVDEKSGDILNDILNDTDDKEL